MRQFLIPSLAIAVNLSSWLSNLIPFVAVFAIANPPTWLIVLMLITTLMRLYWMIGIPLYVVYGVDRNLIRSIQTAKQTYKNDATDKFESDAQALQVVAVATVYENFATNGKLPSKFELMLIGLEAVLVDIYLDLMRNPFIGLYFTASVAEHLLSIIVIVAGFLGIGWLAKLGFAGLVIAFIFGILTTLSIIAYRVKELKLSRRCALAEGMYTILASLIWIVTIYHWVTNRI